ncbi:MAG: mechanosensitive ion channel family protein [Rhodocyclales bacterium GT-UBC]|nr:MAG: mechanosensitive ion channel family protein [Rhodocyclales bacterium GT-UBC]
MHRWLQIVRWAVIGGWMVLALAAEAREPAVPEAVFRLANREVVVLRTTIQGATPEIRVRRIEERLRQMSEADLAQPLSRAPLVLDGRKGVVFNLGDRMMFIVYESDLDEELRQGLDEAAAAVEARFGEALAIRIEQGRGPVLLRGILLSVLATGLALLTLWIIQRMMRLVLIRLRARAHGAQQQVGRGVRWAEHIGLLFSRLARLVLAFLWVSVAYLWFIYVLGAFPLTQPYAEKLSGFLVELLGVLGHGALSAVPGLLTAVVVLFLTKAVNDVVANVFRNVDLGKSVIPGIHADTAKATRRLVGILIWGFGLAVAYPYLPLADSEAFKGLSVMFGFMLTLGSAGIVTQVMSGLVLIYSRALRVGDFVSIGEVMGVVREMGVLSTKVINMRNEEITIPNAVLVGNPIKNYSSAGGERGALISTTVSIGYDTPWRKVHAMLIAAAGETPGLRLEPAPFVMQKGLQDFYVEYELYAYMDRPMERVQVLSALHGNIQDQFNAQGVQIMSPHFVLQPKKPVVVDRDNWCAEPAPPN